MGGILLWSRDFLRLASHKTIDCWSVDHRGCRGTHGIILALTGALGSQMYVRPCQYQ